MRTKTLELCLVFSLIIALAAAGFPAVEEQALEDRDVPKLIQGIQSKTLLALVQELTSDAYAGRLTGTPEYKACAEWVGSRFESWGIKPAVKPNTYLQAFPCPYTLVLGPGEVSLVQGKEKKTYAYEKDYFPGSNSAGGRIQAEVVYVGYGITAPELGYDDYEGIDVRGKIILLEREVPVSSDGDPEIFQKWRGYSFHQYKMKNAAAHGAKGMLQIFLTTNTNTVYIDGFLFSQVAPQVAEDLFAGSGKTTDETKSVIQKTLRPQSFPTGKICILENKTEHHAEGVGCNVIGWLEGSDPKLKNEVIILGGHLDHVGRCHLLMPGANDNASGIAVMMGVAEALAKSSIKLRRSVLFIGTGAEEVGCLGSRVYLADPVFPLEKTMAFINLDSVGCGNVLHASASENYPEIWRFIKSANDRTVHREIRPSYIKNLGRPRFDASEFMWKGIPSISFGASGAPSYSHTTRDTAGTITPEILSDLARILTIAILDMANQD
jgi:hypothetical protein